MRFAHVSDLHLGIELGSYSLIEDQKFILTKIINILDEQKVDALLIAGDVYDKGIASIEAIKLFEEFLKKLVKRNIKVFIISGNHDSAERLSFGRDFMENCGIYFSKIYEGKISPFTLEDSFGKINIFLLPFVRPGIVRHFHEDEKIESFNDAIRVAVKKMEIDPNERNICVAHQNIVGSEKCDSEMPVYGGLDGVEAEIFDDFDYVAIGHLHGPQTLGKKKNIRYCGTPLKYSASEKNQKKSVTIIDVNEKGNLEISTAPLVPMRNLREMKGTFDEIYHQAADIQDAGIKNDFVNVVLTDEDEFINAYYKLKTVIPSLLSMTYDNIRTRTSKSVSEIHASKSMTPLELLDKFYENRNGIPLSAEQKDYISSLIEEIWEESK